ncbi:hypothetical protein [Streptomyces sp. NPDC001068]|uniref:hypothetical protein n=1 Tax=Streptomyces sp. NPDC001068 TaxID=3364544 RepID=UPI00367FC948
MPRQSSHAGTRSRTGRVPAREHERNGLWRRTSAAWDRLRCHIPDNTRPSPCLYNLIRIRVQRIYHLQSVRNTCAHPLQRPLTQKDLDRALVTAYALRAHL